MGKTGKIIRWLALRENFYQLRFNKKDSVVSLKEYSQFNQFF